MDELRAKMAILALADPGNLAPTLADSNQTRMVRSAIDLKNPGLTRAQLEERRWKVSAPVAEASFRQLGQPLEGRAARKIYTWPLILKLEGMAEGPAHRASPDTNPHLFEDLIDAKEASFILGMSQPHLRKMVIAGQLFGCDVIRLGDRGMYRFRKAQVEDEARCRIEARLFGGTARCAQ